MSKNQLINASKSATKRLERAKRQAVLMQVLEVNQADNPTFEQLAEKMRDHPWVAERWPAYSATTAREDFLEVSALVKDDIKDLAMPYFAEQVGKVDEAIDTLYTFSQDTELDYKLRIDALNAMRGYINLSIDLLGTRAPKETHIKQANLNINIDTYRNIVEEAQRQLDNVVDGEIIENES